MRRTAALACLLALVATADAKGGRKPAPAKPAEPAPEIEMAPEPPAPEPAPAPEPEANPLDAPASPDAAVTKTATSATARHPFYVRAGVALVKPLASSRELELADISGSASLAVQNGPIAGSGADISSATIPAVILGYQTRLLHGRLAFETVLGAPFTVKFRATGTLANESIAPMALGIPTGVPALGPDLGEATAAPPLVTAVYKPRTTGTFRPFVGGGVAVLIAYGARVTNKLLTEVSQPEFVITPAPGLVLQTGADVHITSRWYARLDVKFIALMQARAEVKHVQVRTPELPLFDTVEVGTAKMSVWVNPLIVQGALGADF
jgi:outer membrane protein W